MEPTWIALIILALIYVPIWFWVKFNPKAKDYKLSTWGPAVMVRTTWGLELMGKLSKYKRFWRFCGLASRIITLLLMVYIVSIIVIDLILIPNVIGRKGIGIEYALAIPGINPMLPLVYGWIALIIAMCVHELAHGIQTRANDMDVDSSGVLYGVVPLGAFVEPNEEQLMNCKRRAKMDVYAAGITTNFLLAVVCFTLMFGMMSGVTVQHGDNAAIYGTTGITGSDGIENSAIIMEVDGSEISTLDAYYDFLDDWALAHSSGCGSHSITYIYHDETKTASNVMLGVYVNNTADGTPAYSAGIRNGDFISGMKLNDATEYRYFGTVAKWSSFMSNETHPNDKAIVQYYRYDSGTKTWVMHETEQFELGDKNGAGYLGISTTTGGFNYVTPNSLREASLNPFYGKDNLAGYAMGVFTFIGKAFQGYSPVPEATHWWYHSTFLPDDVFWIVVSLLFWIFWLNMVLGVTNALPAVPFDGGFLYAGGLDYLYEKFGVKDEKIRERKVNNIVSLTSYFMIAVLILVLFVIIF